MTNSPKIVYFDRWMHSVGPEYLTDKMSEIDIVRLDLNDNSNITWKHLGSAHGYQMLPRTETDKIFYPNNKFIQRCPNLLCVSSTGAGYDHIDVEACTDAGILVINQSGSNAESVAQHVLGMMLVLCKQIIQSDRAIRSVGRDWNRWSYMGHELTGRTLGLIGLGHIGRRIARICQTAFSMRVIAYDPYIENHEFSQRHSEKATLLQVMSESDFVSVHCPLSASTRGMISDKQIAMMKPDAIFISAARGGIHDEVALERALANGRIAGVGLDVFEDEPPHYEHPILAYPNTIVSPHNAGITSDCLYNMALCAAEQWVEVFSGCKPSLVINSEVWEKYCDRFEKIFGKRP